MDLRREIPLSSPIPLQTIAMEVQVKFFATLRDVVGAKEMGIEIPEGTTVAMLLDHLASKFPAIDAHRPTLLTAVNLEFEGSSHRLRQGDEVALMPPVSGGGGMVVIQEGPLEVAPVIDSVRDPARGATAVFVGSVRADPGVHGLEYEAYDAMALAKMEEIRRRALEKFEIAEMAIHHRKGRLRVGEDSVVIAAAGAHRQETFEACRWAMEELKVKVPIWKTKAWDPKGS